jgi:glycosyltransferase involved in cell wall biosynthesis
MISVVTPVHNEEAILGENAKKLIAHISSVSQEAELILIDNGSTDATPGIAEGLSRADGRIKALSIPEKDLGAALREGILAASGEYVVWYPIDLSIDFSYIGSSLKEIAGFDMVVGSKEHPESSVVRSKTRKFLSFFYNSFVNLLFNLHISDTQCVKTFRASTIKRIAEQSKSSGIVWEVELIYRAKKAGLRVKEVPVKVCDMRKGSKIRPLDMLKAFYTLVRLRLSL